MPQSSWTAAHGFSNTQGANGWFYERPMNQLLVWADGRWQTTADIDTPYIGPGVMHPGLLNNRAHDAVLRWDAPHSGIIRITGRVTRHEAPRGDGVRVRVTRNHAKVWPPGGTMADAWQTLAVDNKVGLDHDFCVAVDAGDQIRFVVNMNEGSAIGDATAWNPTISYTDRPQAPVIPAKPPAITPTEHNGRRTFYPTESNEVLINPDKGWIAYEAEGNRCRGGGHPEYLAEVTVPGDTLADVPVSDIYTRIPWSCFENAGEGVYDWSWLDRVFSRFEGTGRTFSFRIANYGYWGPTPCDRVYSVPQWVEVAGAKGEIVNAIEWRPFADDPIYLQKLTRFMNALGQHYRDRDDISYIDLGSLGRWGEGHNQPFDLATFQRHWTILENAFPGRQLVVNDDMGPECCDWALDERGAWIRDDSPFRWDPHSFPCMRRARVDRPNIMESRHIFEWQRHENLPNVPWQMVKEDLEATLSCRSAPVSYAGIHHYPRDFVNNLGQDWVDYWANRMGYWFIVKQVQVPSPLVPNAENTLELHVENRGVDRVHRGYRLALALTRISEQAPAYWRPVIASDARDWLPEQTTSTCYTWWLGDIPGGEYHLDIGLVAPDGDDMRAVVKLGNYGRLANDYLRLGTIRVAGPRDYAAALGSST